MVCVVVFFLKTSLDSPSFVAAFYPIGRVANHKRRCTMKESREFCRSFHTRPTLESFETSSRARCGVPDKETQTVDTKWFELPVMKRDRIRSVPSKHYSWSFAAPISLLAGSGIVLANALLCTFIIIIITVVVAAPRGYYPTTERARAG